MVDTARRLYETVECLSVCLSVCPIVRQPLRRAAAECTASSEYRDSAGAGAQPQRRRHGARSTTLSSKCGQCRVDSRGTRLSTDLSIRAVTGSDAPLRESVPIPTDGEMYQLLQMDPCDALPHARRAVDGGRRSV